MNPSATVATWIGSTALGVGAAAGTDAGGVDFAGLAALITALSGLIATLGAIYLGSRKRSNDTTDQALKLLLELQQKKMDEDDGDRA